MKFGHVFHQHLRAQGFPPEWIDSALSYAQLKKCINRLARELAHVGLDADTLRKLLRHVEEFNTADPGHGRPFEYILSTSEAASDSVDSSRSDATRAPPQPFQPKLRFRVDERSGHVQSASLDPETRTKLHQLAVATGMSDFRVADCGEDVGEEEPGSPSSGKQPCCSIVTAPLTSDSDFFTMLSSGLSRLEVLQREKERQLHAQIAELGQQVSRLTDSRQRQNRRSMVRWRRIFQAYVESAVFFGTTEADSTARGAEVATQRFQAFANTIAEQELGLWLRRDGVRALNTFMQINQQLLLSLRFQEINRIATTKILKKFDKRTSLGVEASFPRPDLAATLAKAVCYRVHTEILGHVPRLDDYCCPMCFEIEWRPVKLACDHVFCIRCLIVMQTNKQGRCPLCRQRTVVGANSGKSLVGCARSTSRFANNTSSVDNLDVELANYLKRWFPDEVKAKQQYNVQMAGAEEYEEVHSNKCTTM